MRVPPVRFSLLGLMALVAYLAIACAALRYATELWASAVFTLSVVLLLLALLGVCFREEHARAAWIGFLVFGGIYLLLASGPWSQTSPTLITGHGLAWLQQKLHGDRAAHYETKVQMALETPVTGYGATGSAVLTANRVMLFDTMGRNSSASAQPVFARIGHALLAPLIGLVGAVIASWLYAGNCGKSGAENGA